MPPLLHIAFSYILEYSSPFKNGRFKSDNYISRFYFFFSFLVSELRTFGNIFFFFYSLSEVSIGCSLFEVSFKTLLFLILSLSLSDRLIYLFTQSANTLSTFQIASRLF